MKKIATLVTVGTIGFFVGSVWTCIRICQMVDAGLDVTNMVKQSIDKGENYAEVHVNKWRRKYSEVHR